jgi:hypothetical protein
MTETTSQAATAAVDTAKAAVSADVSKAEATVKTDVSKAEAAVETEAKSLWSKIAPYAIPAATLAAGFLVGKLV